MLYGLPMNNKTTRQTEHEYPAEWYERFPEPPVWSVAWGSWRGRNEQIDKYGHEPRVTIWGRECLECGRRVGQHGTWGRFHSDGAE